MIGVLGEIGEEADDRVGVQQLRKTEIGTLTALELKAALFTLAGRDDNHAAVVDGLVVDRQRIGGWDTGAVAVVHGARHADEHDALEAGVAEGGQPPPRAASSMKAVTCVHSPRSPGNSGLISDQ